MLQAVDLRDVRMIEREDVRFTLETRESFGISGHQDRYNSFQVGVGGFVDFTHPADADERGVGPSGRRVPRGVPREHPATPATRRLTVSEGR